MSFPSGVSTDSNADILRFVASSQLPTPWAVFQIHAFAETASGKEHVALTLGDVSTDEPVLARIHS